MSQHSSVSIGGLLGVLNSWDSDNAGNATSPDYFSVFLDGNELIKATFNNTQGTNNTLFGTLLTDVSKPNLYKAEPNQTTFWGEQAFDFNGYSPLTNIAHSGDSLKIDFIAHGAGWQGGVDEGFALDRLNVTTNSTAVPEPSTLAIFALGIMGLASRRFKKQA